MAQLNRCVGPLGEYREASEILAYTSSIINQLIMLMSDFLVSKMDGALVDF